ncbi:MAG: CoA transferase, partial [Frankiaceae bacterium]|nr:CoA transferase [Frankiaceae bacterium]
MQALEGIRVLDLTRGIAGPITGMWLADFGAQVVKIEPPAGDPGRAEPGFAMWNRGKRSVVVDPGDAAKLDWLRRQCLGADVLLTNGEGQLEEFGLDAYELLRANGRLVLTEMAPYLPGYTPWAGGHESAGLLAAYGGPAWRQSSISGDPVESVYPTLLYAHGIWAAVCTAATLLERERSGAGQMVQVSGVNALQHLAASSYIVNPDNPDISTAVGPGGRSPMYARFQAGDGGWVASGALGVKYETALLNAMGLGDVLEDERINHVTANLLSTANIDWVKKRVQDAFLTKTAEEWLTILDDLGIPSGPLADRNEWLDHPQIKAIGMRAEVDDPQRGRVVMPGIPLNLTGTPGQIQGPAPMLGQHSDDAPDWPAQPPGADRPQVRPGPLSGITILNSGTFVASPYAGCLMSELGATVVKIEPPTGEAWRKSGYGVNRGMRSLAIDLQTPQGQAAFHRVVQRADAYIDGLRPGVTTKLRVDYDTLKEVKPDIVTMSLSAYGEGGPIGTKSGVDMVLQGMSGMMSAQGGSGDPVSNTIAICDMTTAAVSSMAIILALIHRERTGEGQRAWDALSATATYLQSGELVRYATRPPALIGGADFHGRDPYDRMYPVADGWIRLQATTPGGRSAAEAASAVAAALGIEKAALAADPTAAIEAAVESLSGDEATAALNGGGVAAVRVRKSGEVLRDPRLLAYEFLHVRPSDNGGFISDPGRYAVFSRTGRYGPKVPPGIGEHSRLTLAAAGFDEAEIDQLVDSGIVVQGGPMEHVLAAAYRE